jgi:hypothetical protein
MIKLQRLASALLSRSIKGHFGQWGEDILVRKLFPKNRANGTYLDIGCYHPFIHSNTAYLWLKGWRGYNIDANAQTIKIFDKIRPQDANIWLAIIAQSQYDAGLREVSLLTPDASDNASGISATGTVHQAVGSGHVLLQPLALSYRQPLSEQFNGTQLLFSVFLSHHKWHVIACSSDPLVS